MLDERKKGTYMIGSLIIVLLIILGQAFFCMIEYYRSADYIVDKYSRYLIKGNYEDIYRLLEKTSIQSLGGQDAVYNYYEQTYAKQQKLIDVKVMAKRDEVYQVIYQFHDEQVAGTLNVVKEKGKWRVVFPFTYHEIEVLGPIGCEIYVGDRKLKACSKGRYITDSILPGRYMLLVKFPHEDYSNYYSTLTVPDQKKYTLPYVTGELQVDTAPGMEVEVNSFKKVTKTHVTVFNRLLQGEYQVCVKDTFGYIDAQHSKVNITQQRTHLRLNDFVLSDLGEQTNKEFFKKFYEQYLIGIKTHSAQPIEGMLSDTKAQAIEENFEAWYIKEKDIYKVELDYQLGDAYVDSNGKLHQMVDETVTLQNKVVDDSQGKVFDIYRVKIRWETIINILQEQWKIEDRKVIESIVAFQDEEGKWVQY